MEKKPSLVATAIVALFAAGAYAACPVSPGTATAVAVTTLTTDEVVPGNLDGRQKSNDSLQPLLIAPLDAHEPDRRDGALIPIPDDLVPQDRVSAARSAERRFERREPPPRHLVAFRPCRDPEQQLPVAG
jgi:hypothetical protein